MRTSRCAPSAGRMRSHRWTIVTCAERPSARPTGSATRSRRDRRETGSISPLAHRGREGSRRTGIGGSIGRIGGDGTYLSPGDPEYVPVMETNKTGGRVRAARASCAGVGLAYLPSTNLARSFSFAPPPRPSGSFSFDRRRFRVWRSKTVFKGKKCVFETTLKVPSDKRALENSKARTPETRPARRVERRAPSEGRACPRAAPR